MNIFEKVGNDENQSTNDPLQMSIGPITRERVKKDSRSFQWACEGVYGVNPQGKIL